MPTGPAADRTLTTDENAAVQSAMSLTQAQVDEMQGTTADASAKAKNVRLSLIKLAALVLAQS